MLEVYECDICGQPGTRYQIVFEDGTKVLDRCSRHGKKLEALREEKGEWEVPRPSKQSFRKSSLSELRLAVAEGAAAKKEHDGQDEE